MIRIGNNGDFYAELTNGRVVLWALHLYDIVNLKKQMVRFKGIAMFVFRLDCPAESSDLFLVSAINKRDRIRALKKISKDALTPELRGVGTSKVRHIIPSDKLLFFNYAFGNEALMQRMQYYRFWTAWLTLATAELEAFRTEFTLGNWSLPHSLHIKPSLAYFAMHWHIWFRLKFFQARLRAIILLHKILFFRNIVRQGIKLLPAIFQFRRREGNIWKARIEVMVEVSKISYQDLNIQNTICRHVGSQNHCLPSSHILWPIL